MLEELLNHLNEGNPLLSGSKLAQAMQEISIETQKQLGEMNHTYKTDMEMKEAVANIIGEDIPDTVRIRQPFYMDFGKIFISEKMFLLMQVFICKIKEGFTLEIVP